MKKVVSIFLSLIMLMSTVHLTVSTHYCMGNIAATKVSLDGEIATCGMEKPATIISYSETISRQCCEDVTSGYSIDNNYVPESINIGDSFQHIIDTFIVPVDFLVSSSTFPIATNNWSIPPCDFDSVSTDLSVLCIYRI